MQETAAAATCSVASWDSLGASWGLAVVASWDCPHAPWQLPGTSYLAEPSVVVVVVVASRPFVVAVVTSLQTGLGSAQPLH